MFNVKAQSSSKTGVRKGLLNKNNFAFYALLKSQICPHYNIT